MEYVIDKTDGQWSVTVRDDEGDLVSVPAADRGEANALVRKAAAEGWQAISSGKVERDPLDHDGDGRKGGSVPAEKPKGRRKKASA